VKLRSLLKRILKCEVTELTQFIYGEEMYTLSNVDFIAYCLNLTAHSWSNTVELMFTSKTVLYYLTSSQKLKMKHTKQKL